MFIKFIMFIFEKVWSSVFHFHDVTVEPIEQQQKISTQYVTVKKCHL